MASARSQGNRDYESTLRVSPTAPAAADIASTLRELAALRDEGALTEAEFTAAKARVLGGQVPVT